MALTFTTFTLPLASFFRRIESRLKSWKSMAITKMSILEKRREMQNMEKEMETH